MVDLRTLWDFGNPELSEKRFREFLPEAGDQHLEVIAQIARTFSLRKRFDEAAEVLEEIQENWEAAPERARVGYYLEMGRCLNSSGDPAGARPYFEKASAEAVDNLDLKIDAIHMLGIVSSGEESLDFNMQAIDSARHATDPKARRWLASLLNNTAWTLHDMDRYHDALALFQEAVTERELNGEPEPLRFAKWAVARCKRSIGLYDEALAEQQQLLTENQGDGFVHEEIAENLWELGRLQEASNYFATAANLLSNVDWVDPQRLANLRSRADA